MQAPIFGGVTARAARRRHPHQQARATASRRGGRGSARSFQDVVLPEERLGRRRPATAISRSTRLRTGRRSGDLAVEPGQSSFPPHPSCRRRPRAPTSRGQPCGRARPGCRSGGRPRRGPPSGPPSRTRPRGSGSRNGRKWRCLGRPVPLLGRQADHVIRSYPGERRQLVSGSRTARRVLRELKMPAAGRRVSIRTTIGSRISRPSALRRRSGPRVVRRHQEAWPSVRI